MLRTSLFFLLLAILATIFADIEISTLHPWQEIGSIFYGALTPDFVIVPSTMSYSIVNTIVFALCGTFGGFLLGILLAPFFSLTWIRLFCSFLRSIHEIFLGLYFSGDCRFKSYLWGAFHCDPLWRNFCQSLCRNSTRSESTTVGSSPSTILKNESIFLWNPSLWCMRM